jgi:hypothetical protein
MEIWKDVKGYEGLYQVSTSGNVKSVFRYKKILKQKKDRYGYLCVSLYGKTKRKDMTVHRLVAGAFIENQENKETVNHKDSNRKNNNVENLEWATWMENGKFINKTSKKTKSKYKGVTLLDDRYKNRPWVARIAFENKRIYLGHFKTEHEAAIAYNNAALKHHKNFALLNKF